MKDILKIRKCFWVSALLLLFNGLSFLFMRWAVMRSESSGGVTVMALGVFFWLTLIGGYVLLSIANRRRKRFIVKKMDGDLSMSQRTGLLSFFRNKYGTASDVVLLLSVIGLLVLGATKATDGFLVYVLLSLLAVSFHMHCLFNGRVYKATLLQRMKNKES